MVLFAAHLNRNGCIPRGLIGRAALVLGLVSLAIGSVQPAGAVTKPRGAAIASSGIDTLQGHVDGLVAAGAPGAIAFVRRGDRTWRGASGFADAGGRLPARPDMIWRVASVTKLVTAHIALQLEAERVVSLRHPLARYVSYVPTRVGRLTLLSLLDQTSWVSDYLDEDVFGPGARSMVRSLSRAGAPEVALNRALAGDWTIDPMSEHQYANTNFVLLQHAMESATGVPFETLVRWHIVNPLKLTQTGLVTTDGALPALPHLRAHIRDDVGPEVFSPKGRLIDVTGHQFLTGGDGGLYGSADDLAKIMAHIWLANAVDGKPLGKMIGRLRSDHDGLYAYGLGLMAVELSCGVTVYGHEGLDIGSVTFAFADASGDRQFVAVANVSTDRNAALDAAMQRFREAIFCGG